MALHRCGMGGSRKVAAGCEDAIPHGTVLTLSGYCSWLDADVWAGMEVVVEKGREG